MPRRVRLLAMTVILLAVAAVPAHETAAAETDGWQAVPSPDLRVPWDLRDVVATSGGSAIAVGSQLLPVEQLGPGVVLRWNGRRWAVDRRFPNEANDDNVALHLFGVDALGPDNVWAVGSTDFRPIAEHWDGKVWRSIPGIVDPAVGSEFIDVTVASSSTVWTVANELVVPPLSPVAQRWDGQQWTRFPLPHPFDDFVQVLAVEALGPDDVWAVGHGRSGPTLDLLPIAWHWDGTAWSYVLMPRLGALQVTPTDLVAVSPTEIWAVGYKLVRLDDPGNLPAVERWDGTAWQEVAGPDVPADAYPHAVLDAVAADGQGGIWAAGSTVAPNFPIEPSFTSFFAHFQNGSWTVQIEPDSLQGEIRGLTQVPATTTLWAVGATRDRIGGCGPCRGLIGLLGPPPR
jgi:hypothetical protein